MIKKIFFLRAILFVLTLFLTFIYLFALLCIPYKFGILSAANVLWGTVIISLLFLILYYILKRNLRIDNWISQNQHKMMLYYIVSMIVFVSIKTEAFLTLVEIKEVISLCWTIIGISITIFLVWNVLILNYLKDKKPKSSSNMNLIDKSLYLYEKGVFFENASTLFNTVTILLVNLFVLTIATAMVFVVKIDAILLRQNMATIAFYFCSNTLAQVFLDILLPINEDKKILLKGMKKTHADVSSEVEINEQIEQTYTSIEIVKRSKKFSEEEKKRIIGELLDGVFAEPLSSVTSTDSDK